MTSESDTLWEVHIRVPPNGPLAVSCKRAGRYLTNDVARFESPADALRLLEKTLEPFGHGDQLFITARNHDGRLSLWSTSSRSVGLYWCAVAVAQLWLKSAAVRTAPAQTGTVAIPPLRRERTVA